MNRSVPRRVCRAIVVVSLCASSGAVQAGGRVPYGGHLRVMVPQDEVDGWHRSVSDCYLFRAAPGAEPEPELDPQGLRSRAYGFRH